jgi:hypothetical protein
MPRFDQPIEPMTLGNMRELGVRVVRWPDDVAVPTHGHDCHDLPASLT